jgi:uncharacterized protein
MTALVAALGAILFVTVLLAGAFLTLLGIPGTFVILLDALIYSAATGWQRLPWGFLLALAGIAVVAEVSDNIVSAVGVRKYGGSNKGMVWALLAGLAGALVLGAALSPLGLVGGIVGPLVGGLLGGFVGGYAYERAQGRSAEEARKAGLGAVWGRVAGTMLKTILAGVMVAMCLVQAF